ncbi:phosphoribosyltransferase [Paenibacillus sp. TRM 82003]|nr:phosphoribosyltransferase [Paenibacillus sp. TRM 82003]MCI3923403.1 phosphoribosyltransferase [Paenibacillus sp. TRM 82003]
MYQTQTGINYLCIYHPYWGGNNPDFNNNSRLILDLKGNVDSGINHFFPILDKVLSKGVLVTIVPSHNPANREGGLKRLAVKLAQSGRHDGTSCLVRTRLISKLATGGNRSADVHVGSISVQNKFLIKDKQVVVLDDVTTSGNSLLACRSILLTAGAANVHCWAIGKTA